MGGWKTSPPMLDESPTEIGVAGEWVRDVEWARSKLPGAGIGSKLLLDVGPESMAKWADSLTVLDESPTMIGMAGEWVRDVVWARSKLRGAGVDSEMLMDVGPESMAKGTEIGVAGEWVRDVAWARSKLKGAGADSEMLMDVGPESMAEGDALGV